MSTRPQAPAASLTERFHSALRSQAPAVTYKLWLSDLSLSADSSGCLRVVVPAGRRKWLAERYGDLVLRAARAVIGAHARVTYEAREQVPNPGPRRSHSDRRAETSLTGSSPLDPQFRFDTYVVHDGNRLAHAAALTIAEHRTPPFPVLLIHGSRGTGKSHLVQASAALYRSAATPSRVAYFTAQDFTSAFVRAVRARAVTDLRETLGRSELLVVDDLDLLLSRTQTAEVLGEVILHLRTRGSKVLLVASKQVDRLTTSAPTLARELDAALPLEVTDPPKDAAPTLAHRACQATGVVLPDPVIQRICDLSPPNPLALHSAVVQVSTYASLRGEPPSTELVDHLLTRTNPPQLPRPDADLVLAAVTDCFSIPLDAIRGRTRTTQVTRARAAAALLLRELARATLPEIGRLLGGRSHSTVVGMIRSAKDLAQRDRRFSDLLAHTRSRAQLHPTTETNRSRQPDHSYTHTTTYPPPPQPPADTHPTDRPTGPDTSHSSPHPL